MCSPRVIDFAYTLETIQHILRISVCQSNILQISLWEIYVGEISYSS
jgi:hypothetical protein